MRKGLGVVVATRRLRAARPPGRLCTVAIGRPRRVRPGEWACPYRVTGIGSSEVRYAHGVDAVQALLLAFQGVRVRLGATRKRLT